MSGTITFLIVAFIVWVVVSLLWGPGAMEINEYHPFRSATAKGEFLKHYDARAQKWPVVSETKLVETSFGQTFVRISGPVDAPPLVLLPGGGATSLIWLPNIEALSNHYRTYAVDNIYDFGRSVYTRSMTSPDDFTNWLDELFSALELGDNINLMGYSYGGWLACQFTLDCPERLDKVVLVSPASTVLPLSGEFLTRSVLCLVPFRYFTKSIMYWVWEDLVQRDETGRAITDDRVDDVVLAFRSFKFKVPANPTIFEDEELKSIKVPTLFLIGENEKIYSAQEAVQRLTNVASQIEVEVIPDAGHDLTFLQTEMVNSKVLEFLKKP